MFCTKCGNEISTSAQFCSNCGEAINRGNQQSENTNINTNESADQNGKKSSKKGLKIALIIVASAIVLSAAYFIYESKKLGDDFEEYLAQIHQDGIPCFEKESKGIEDNWDRKGFFDLGDKQEIVDQIFTLKQKSAEGAKELENAVKEADELSKEITFLNIGSLSEYGDYEKALNTYKDCISKKDTEQLQTLKQNATQNKDKLLNAIDVYIVNLFDEYNRVDLSTADKTDKKEFSAGVEALKSYYNKKDYAQMSDAIKKINQVYLMYAEPDEKLDIVVQQMDVTNYPNIKLFLNVKDEAGEVLDSLNSDSFFVRKKNSKGEYIKQKIEKACQLNEAEALNIDMVADISGSMSGSNIEEAKNAMNSFVSNVQFSAGDQVQLTTFSDYAEKKNDFTNEAGVIQRVIDSLDAVNGGTALYDTLFVAVDQVAARKGAKCVIAFTDGLDNRSSRSAQDVINEANRYHVPVFIVSVGDSYNYDLEDLANRTGGMYSSISTFSEMSDIYEEIYKQEKEMYMIEFKDTSEVSLYKKSTIVAGYHSLEYGGEIYDYNYIPYTMVNVDSMKNSTFEQNTPENTVSAYIVNFADAMTSGDYAHIEPYLKGVFAKEQKSYVGRMKYDENLESYEITSVKYKGKSKCVISTRETYYVYYKDTGHLKQYMTQVAKYQLTKKDGIWKIEKMLSVDVVNKIQYE